MNTSELYDYFKKCSSLSTDTRSLNKKSIFFALKGDNFNGNKFAEEAIKNGASYACLLYTSPSPRDVEESRMPSSA